MFVLISPATPKIVTGHVSLYFSGSSNSPIATYSIYHIEIFTNPSNLLASKIYLQAFLSFWRLILELKFVKVNGNTHSKSFLILNVIYSSFK